MQNLIESNLIGILKDNMLILYEKYSTHHVINRKYTAYVADL